MKKFVIMLALLSMTKFCAVAQSSMRLVSYAFAVGAIDNNDHVRWGDWEASNVPISMNAEEGRIRIFSSEEQDYQVLKDLGESEGVDWREYEMKCMDNNGLICKVSFRKDYSDGVMQLYIEYSDYIWVYNVRRY